MSVLIRDSRTGIDTSTELTGSYLDLFLRQNPNYSLVGIATTANAIYYPLLNDSTIKFNDPVVQTNFVFNPGLTRLGIGTPNPQATLDVNGTIKFAGYASFSGISTFYGPVYFYSDVNLDRFVAGVGTITKRFDVGYGGTVFTVLNSKDPNIVGVGSTYSGNVGIGTTIPTQKLDVVGSVHISQSIYDSINSSGTIGAFLTNDSTGIRWTALSPSFSEGIFVYNEGTLVGSGQSFRGINVKTGRSSGTSVDPVQAYVNPTNSTIADVYVYDYWDYNGSGDIYRSSKVGINNISPSYQLDVTGDANISSNLYVSGPTLISNTLEVTQATTLDTTLEVKQATILDTTLQVGVGGTVITTTGIGSVGIGTNFPTKGIDLSKDIIIKKALYDTNNKVGYDTNFYQTPRSVLTQVGVGTTGQIISGRFFDAANIIRLNLDFIAAEAIGFITSTDYKNPAFQVPGVGGVSTCRSDIKKILKAITLDITKGGNSQSVGAGLSYYNGSTLIHITGNDTNGYSIKDATIVAITTAVQLARYAINNVTLPKSYQSGVSSISQVKDLSLQNDPAVGINTSLSGCSNVVSAIYTCAGIVTTIIGGGPSVAPNITYPDARIVWAPAGADSRNNIWVSKYGNDDNTGNTEGDAKLTIGAACEVAQAGDTLVVRPGIYYENNPIGLRTDVSLSGQDLRLVTVVPRNLNKDVFHVRRGCLIENLNFSCETGQSNVGGGAVAFPPTTTDILSGKSYSAVSGYIAPGPANEGPSGRWRSPYIRNCTNFMPKSIGMKINGDHATASTPGNDLKCMVCDSFTQYNEAGIGVSITNNGYAQLVSIFTINCHIGIYCDTGGSCDITNSNSSFGNYGLYADGVGSLEFTATTLTATTNQSDTFVMQNVLDAQSRYRTPYNGQAIWFHIPVSTGILTAPMRNLSSITVLNGGSGFSPSAPPSITIVDTNNNNSITPLGPQGIIAQLSPTIDITSGKITSIDVVSSGRNYLPTQNMVLAINGIPQSTSNFVVNMTPVYYTVSSASSVSSSGISTVILNEFIPYLVGAGISISMYRISRIQTSSHSFEYIGSGTDINTSNPYQGATFNSANQVVAINGALIPYTSTNQAGNFEIGKGITIDQTTNTIRGRDFNRAIQANVTPLILALR